MIKIIQVFGLIILVLGGLQLTACTSARVPTGAAEHQPSLVKQAVFHTSDGSQLYAQHWLPEAPPKAVLLLLHGFNEYSGAFASVGEYFAERGVAVWAYDQRGFGRSPYRGLWSSAERMAQDAQEMAQLLRREYPDTPLYSVGSSMGGAVSLLAAAEYDLDVDGVVLVAPAVWTSETQPFYQRWGLELALKFAPGWSPDGQSLDISPTDNSALFREIWRSPWMMHGGSRMDTVAGLVDLMNKSFDAAPEVTQPVLLLYGHKDQLVPVDPINKLWARLPKTQAKTQQIRYPNGWHMLLRDLQGEKVMADIIEWIEG